APSGPPARARPTRRKPTWWANPTRSTTPISPPSSPDSGDGLEARPLPLRALRSLWRRAVHPFLHRGPRPDPARRFGHPELERRRSRQDRDRSRARHGRGKLGDGLAAGDDLLRAACDELAWVERLAAAICKRRAERDRELGRLPRRGRGGGHRRIALE